MAIMFCMELDFLIKIEQLKREMSYLPCFSIRNLFLAVTDKNYISESILRRYLRKVGHQPVKEEVLNMMRRLDLNGERKISFEDFCEAFEP